MTITGVEFQLEKIPLKTVRPFVMDQLVLAHVQDLDVTDKFQVQEAISEKVLFAYLLSYF